MSSEDSLNRLQDGTDCQTTEKAILCANSCGFFGSAATMNLCSVCFKDFQVQQNQAASAKSAVEKSLGASIAIPAPPPVPLCPAPASSSSSSETGDSTTLSVDSVKVSTPSKPDSAVKSRCSACRKRVGLTGFTCRCGSTFCARHRYPEEHGCEFDFKAVGRDAIAKANPVVKADKLERI